ncbi:MAG: hypothetical protein R6V04_12665 [bacterium]
MLKKPKLKVFSAVVVLALLLNLFILMNPDKASAKKTPKQITCELVGCYDGQRPCAEAVGHVDVPGIGGFSVTYHCYEPDYNN